MAGFHDCRDHQHLPTEWMLIFTRQQGFSFAHQRCEDRQARWLEHEFGGVFICNKLCFGPSISVPASIYTVGVVYSHVLDCCLRLPTVTISCEYRFKREGRRSFITRGKLMTSRRQFIQIVPFTGAALLVGCSDKPAASSSTAAPAPAPAASPAAPAPAAPAATAAPAAPAPTATAALPMVDEKDPAAVNLGYVADATKADTAKFKTYAAGQQCSGCVLYQGAAGSEAGPCPLFAGKQVTAKGWCGSFAKKAA
jgi:pyruvate/2-oxoglutarate dehydrogenase complex dihydrolipoamide acyltransferase (E2) component